MANIVGRKDNAGFIQLFVDDDPNASGGTPGPIGAIAQLVGSGSGLWIKDGPNDEDWSSYSNFDQSIALSSNSSLVIPTSAVTGVPWTIVDGIDDRVFDFTVGSIFIQILRAGTFQVSGQVSIIFDGGSVNSRTTARGHLWVQPGGVGSFSTVQGTRSHGYHRRETQGNDTLSISKRLDSVSAGTRIVYGVQRVNGNGQLILDDEGCNITVTRIRT